MHRFCEDQGVKKKIGMEIKNSPVTAGNAEVRKIICGFLHKNYRLQ
jgi:hypothetical protein